MVNDYTICGSFCDSYKWLIIYNVIVVESNDNEWPQVPFQCFLICVPVPVIRGLTGFLTMADIAEFEDGVVIFDCVAIFL